MAPPDPAPRPSGIQQAIAVAGRYANLIVDTTHIGPFAVLYADFTELRYSGGRHKGYLITLLDYATKGIVGWAVGNWKTTEVALQALGADEANAGLRIRGTVKG